MLSHYYQFKSIVTQNFIGNWKFSEVTPRPICRSWFNLKQDSRKSPKEKNTLLKFVPVSNLFGFDLVTLMATNF